MAVVVAAATEVVGMETATEVVGMAAAMRAAPAVVVEMAAAW
jgi:hypothetical protein